MKTGTSHVLLSLIAALPLMAGCGPTPTSRGSDPLTVADTLSLILDTDDGGVTWTSYHTDLVPVLKGIALLGPTSIVAVGSAGRIIHTSDGGSHWTPQTSNVNTFLQDITGSVVAGEGIAVGTEGTILHTADAGETWSSRTSGVTASLNAVELYPLGIGLAVGDFNTILRSTDRGRSWTSVNGGGFEAFNGVAFATDSIAVTVGSSGTIMRSTDAGATWMAVTSGINRDLDAITFLSPTIGIAVGMYDNTHGTQIFKTTDAGLTWQPRPSGLPATYTLKDVVWTFESLIAVGTKRRILRSTDEGETWTLDASQPEGATLNRILFYGGIGHIVGD